MAILNWLTDETLALSLGIFIFSSGETQIFYSNSGNPSLLIFSSDYFTLGIKLDRIGFKNLFFLGEVPICEHDRWVILPFTNRSLWFHEFISSNFFVILLSRFLVIIVSYSIEPNKVLNTQSQQSTKLNDSIENGIFRIQLH